MLITTNNSFDRIIIASSLTLTPSDFLLSKLLHAVKKKESELEHSRRYRSNHSALSANSIQTASLVSTIYCLQLYASKLSDFINGSSGVSYLKIIPIM